MAQQAEKALELQDPEIRPELDRRVREGETVIKGGTGGTNLDAQERLAEGRKKGRLSRTTEPGKGRAAGAEGRVRVEADEAKLEEAKRELGSE